MNGRIDDGFGSEDREETEGDCDNEFSVVGDPVLLRSSFVDNGLVERARA